MNNTRISIVIPVYNEEKQLADCLRAIARQRQKPFEVIVVDNNSTDRSVQIVRRFKFVRVVRAKRQGVVYARDRGFNVAKGDIIGRIDADTRLPSDWTQQVARVFEDKSVDAVSGAVRYYDVPMTRLVSQVDLLVRRHIATMMDDSVFLQAANMAIRKSAWIVCRDELCRRPNLHEDFDLAIHLAWAGRRVVFDEQLVAGIAARCVDDSVVSFWTYVWLSPGTYQEHDLKAGRHMYAIATLMIIFHLPIRAIYRAYNNSSGYRRINPATFVD